MLERAFAYFYVDPDGTIRTAPDSYRSLRQVSEASARELKKRGGKPAIFLKESPRFPDTQAAMLTDRPRNASDRGDLLLRQALYRLGYDLRYLNGRVVRGFLQVGGSDPQATAEARQAFADVIAELKHRGRKPKHAETA